MAIDIGTPAIYRTGGLPSYTLVDKANPANATGSIDTIEIWAGEELVNTEVAAFYVVSGNNLSTRGTATLGTVAAGSKRTFTGLSISVEIGDYIGVYYSVGRIALNTSGGIGLWYAASTDRIPCTNQVFSSVNNYRLSLYGTGTETPPAGWAGGDVLGVDIATIGKISGVALAGITKVNGVA